MRLFKYVSLVLVVTWLLMPVAADCKTTAYTIDASTLVEYMHEYEKMDRGDPNANFYLAGTYIGYVLGVFDSMEYLQRKGNIPNSSRQLCGIAAKYLKNHPEKWHWPASALVKMALWKVFKNPR